MISIKIKQMVSITKKPKKQNKTKQNKRTKFIFALYRLWKKYLQSDREEDHNASSIVLSVSVLNCLRKKQFTYVA